MVKSKGKIILVLTLLFVIVLANSVNAAKVSVGKVKGLKVSTYATTSLKVSWNKVSNATGYRVYILKPGAKKYTYYGKTTSRSMTIKKLTSAKTYKIKVRAYKTYKGKNYYGSYSSVLTTSTKPTRSKKRKNKISNRFKCNTYME